MENQTIIQAIDIHKTYDTGRVKVNALRGVNLEVRRGEMVAIMGPSGCGKTTLLNCLAGLDEIDHGEVFIDKVLMANMSDDERTVYRAKQMGFVFQLYNLLPVLSAVENVELPLLVSGVRAGEARKRARDGLAWVGLAEWANHLPAELSGGQRQRVAIARALVNRPTIIWADEPTGNLDSESADEIMTLMKQLNIENDQTFVIVTHSQEVASWTHRLIRMRDGLVVDDGGSIKKPPQSAAESATSSPSEQGR